MDDVKPLTDDEMAIWRERAKDYDDKEDVAVRLIATVDEKERQRAGAVARRESELKSIKSALRNHHLCKPDCTIVSHIEGVYSDLEGATRRMRELHDALRQAATDIMNLGACLRLESKVELADIAVEQEKAARKALSK